MAKNKGGRPTKMNKRVLNAFEKVLNEEQNALVCTDEELFMLMNEELEKKDQIVYSTFQEWKNNNKKYTESNPKQADLFRQFSGLIKKALVKERKALMLNLKGDEKAWQRWAWIIERKFDEWNIRNKTDMTIAGKKDAPAVRVNILDPGIFDNGAESDKKAIGTDKGATD